MNISALRTLGLALVTLLGAAHLSTAEATPLNVDECDDYAVAYAAGFCAGKDHDDWSSVSYTCEGGRATNISVTCADYGEEEESIR